MTGTSPLDRLEFTVTLPADIGRALHSEHMDYNEVDRGTQALLARAISPLSVFTHEKWRRVSAQIYLPNRKLTLHAQINGKSYARDAVTRDGCLTLFIPPEYNGDVLIHGIIERIDTPVTTR